jgi:hypothetical protein
MPTVALQWSIACHKTSPSSQHGTLPSMATKSGPEMRAGQTCREVKHDIYRDEAVVAVNRE